MAPWTGPRVGAHLGVGVEEGQVRTDPGARTSDSPASQREPPGTRVPSGARAVGAKAGDRVRQSVVDGVPGRAFPDGPLPGSLHRSPAGPREGAAGSLEGGVGALSVEGAPSLRARVCETRSGWKRGRSSSRAQAPSCCCHVPRGLLSFLGRTSDRGGKRGSEGRGPARPGARAGGSAAPPAVGGGRLPGLSRWGRRDPPATPENRHQRPESGPGEGSAAQ